MAGIAKAIMPPIHGECETASVQSGGIPPTELVTTSHTALDIAATSCFFREWPTLFARLPAMSPPPPRPGWRVSAAGLCGRHGALAWFEQQFAARHHRGVRHLVDGATHLLATHGAGEQVDPGRTISASRHTRAIPGYVARVGSPRPRTCTRPIPGPARRAHPARGHVVLAGQLRFHAGRYQRSRLGRFPELDHRPLGLIA
jgi:hypothetical protein